MKKYLNKYNKFIIIFLISLAIELFVFNFSFFMTIFNKEITYENKNETFGYEINEINQKVRNIRIETNYEEYYIAKVQVADEGNNNYYLLNERVISSRNIRSQYFNIHPAGKVKDLKIIMVAPNISVKRVTINPRVPLMISLVRLLIIFIIGLIIYALNPKSKYYEIKMFDGYRGIAFVFEIILLIGSLLGIFAANNHYFEKPALANQHQYNELTDAIRNGRLYISEEDNSDILELENPYDTTERYKVAVQKSLSFKWDHSYYNGKYYVYFGVGPVLLFYLPYNLLTGNHLSNLFVNIFCIVASIFSMTYLLYAICKKWFKDVGLITFLLCDLLLITSSGILYCAKRPDFYNVPVIVALFFTTLGLALFISASTEKKLFKTKIILASCFMAFVALCRPQFLISTFLIIPLYYDYFFKKIDKKKLKEFLCIIIPYIIFAVLTCTYNYARFGNIFDFGVNYNLTTNDMTHRGFALARIPLGLFYYLFAPFKLIPVFPYIDKIPMVNNYFGRTIYEATFGGFFFTHAITIICLFIPKFKKFFKDNKLYLFCILSIIFGIDVIMVDTEMAGILPRYFMDFSYLLLIPSIVILLTVEKNISNNKLLKQIVIVLIIGAIAYEIISLFAGDAPTQSESIPKIYYYFYYLFS